MKQCIEPLQMGISLNLFYFLINLICYDVNEMQVRDQSPGAVRLAL